MTPATRQRPGVGQHGGADVANGNTQATLFDVDEQLADELLPKYLRKHCSECGAQRDQEWLSGFNRTSLKTLNGRCRPCWNERCRQVQRVRSGLPPAPRPGVARTKTCRSCRNVFVTTTDAIRKCGACRPAGRKQLPEATCEWCSSLFMPRQHHQRFCRDACKQKAKRVRLGWQSDRRTEANPTGTVVRSAKTIASPLKIVRCKHCSRLMVARNGRKYCSDPCRVDSINVRVMGLYYMAANSGHVKQAMAWRRHIVEYLADRDGTKCVLCNRHVDITLPSGTRGSDMGPSVDHVIPRSQGGTDDMANLRLTHWKCNRQRGNRGGNEQLRLVG